MNTYNISFKELIDYIRDKDYEISTLLCRIRELENKKEEHMKRLSNLSRILNKAIDFIGEFDSYIPEDDVDDLLLILKGEK